ncbi:hypothetical protein PMAYCL1PPCAC_23904 [Pristionchus mayeri]|uniref:Uncharacterized protein n=1 Tax=Pristionchus mayeri TaxID=1317129 RepID=A0AAN5D160_9BILA|nr:hypothetical protein PMAYCL1PPCAC_23904 [Pristionchus mayeri]
MPSQYKMLYLTHNRKRNDSDFTLPPSSIDCMRRISQWLFNMYVLEEGSSQMNRFNRRPHDLKINQVLYRAAFTFQTVQLKNLYCVIEGNFVQEYPVGFNQEEWRFCPS